MEGLARVIAEESMVHYPKIPGSRHAPDGRCVAFEKYDDTNLHWDWDRDFGWRAFGTRRDTFNLTDASVEEFAHQPVHLRQCAEVFRTTLAIGLERILREHSTRSAGETTSPN